MSGVEQPVTTVREIMERNVACLSEDDDLAIALQLMLWRRIRHLPVTKDGELLGLVSERDLIAQAAGEGSSIRVIGTVRDVMRRNVSTIAAGATVQEAAAKMSIEKIGCLPVVEEGQLVGITTATDVLGASAWTPTGAAQPSTTVADIMSRDPITARTQELLSAAAARMLRRGVRHLPVIDEDGRAVGVLSDRDVRTAYGNPEELREERFKTLTVRSAMTDCVRTIRRDASLRDAYDILIDERFGTLPVVDEEGVVVGVLSYLDLLLWSRPG